MKNAAPNFQRDLATNEGEPSSEFTKRGGHLSRESILELAFSVCNVQRQEIKPVGIFFEFAHKVALRCSSGDCYRGRGRGHALM